MIAFNDLTWFLGFIRNLVFGFIILIITLVGLNLTSILNIVFSLNTFVVISSLTLDKHKINEKYFCRGKKHLLVYSQG